MRTAIEMSDIEPGRTLYSRRGYPCLILHRAADATDCTKPLVVYQTLEKTFDQPAGAIWVLPQDVFLKRFFLERYSTDITDAMIYECANINPATLSRTQREFAAQALIKAHEMANLGQRYHVGQAIDWRKMDTLGFKVLTNRFIKSIHKEGCEHVGAECSGTVD